MNKLLTCTFLQRKGLLSEYSDKYLLKTVSETLDFTGFLEGYRDIKKGPIKGIITVVINACLKIGKGAIKKSPIKGICTLKTENYAGMEGMEGSR